MIAAYFERLNETQGLNFSVFYDALDRGRFLTGLWTTSYICVVAIAASLALGLLGVWLAGSKSRIARFVVRGYVQFFRNTPPLVQLSFFYFAVATLLPTVSDGFGGRSPLVSGTGWAIIAFSLFAGAFNVEIFRAGIEAVPSTTVEAAESLGYTRLQLYVHVVMPLAFRICLPALNNNLINLVKTTTLAYAIGVPELLYAASQIWSESFNVREMMNVLLVTYVLLVAILVFVMGRWEKAMRIPGYST
ncbi:amino acid ABC transporter permease [Bosea sp. RAC05]|jgi:polar amino acid transport system permease protein|uniref:amino acid ABC transporter permease n=1 Tax=unclassified Bosea (in: a-proteobacteria) TaxID=2653178 RepID=UPI00083DFC3D|nr:amino acid ABC transporter permease [Bosea sp. RAC05]AOG07383.1 amino ABC transporter, permease, 3-TM region, His/Glu/Gln/Arg/opine family domain protein [Bosea sp. RAC05]